MSSLRSFLEEDNFTRISLKKTRTLHYKVEARINGKKCWLIVDTGASTSCINLSAADELQLTTQASEILATGAGASGLETQISEQNCLRLGVWEKRNLAFIIMDLSHVNAGLAQAEEDPVTGILGADVLKQARAVIDYGRNCMYFKL
ncbi:retropepsin-like aspartic protease family protein [Gilvibacter sediminis]|uniref:retropepsin-like aspartic protease family protein n=1 Tax=Gilvibacter sediminis TaxID=379071 RepID=UPI0023504F6B|nr:retropepsin-like aspartic protease [Gilvibacter sediminis]MDC7996486.1 retropepsin-like aspartic protease [Gilvibacter sediminis]